jgi:hypothetical protein
MSKLQSGKENRRSDLVLSFIYGMTFFYLNGLSLQMRLNFMIARSHGPATEVNDKFINYYCFQT